MTSSFKFNKPIVVIDLEMTGLDPGKHQIIEIAAAWVDSANFGVIDTFNTLVGPYEGQSMDSLIKDADPMAMHVNGIKFSELEYKPGPDEAVFMLQNWLPDLPQNVKLAGHGMSLDYLFLEKVRQRSGSSGQFPVYRFSFDYLDTYVLAQFLFSHKKMINKYGELLSGSLTNVSTTFGETTKNAHRAGNDVEMARKVLKKFCELVDIQV